MLGSDVVRDLVQRLTHDVRLRFPQAEVVATEGSIGMSLDDGSLSVESWLEDDEDVQPAQAEAFIAETAQNLVDNGWPNDEPWPVCPTHRDHPPPDRRPSRCCELALHEGSRGDCVQARGVDAVAEALFGSLLGEPTPEVCNLLAERQHLLIVTIGGSPTQGYLGFLQRED